MTVYGQLLFEQYKKFDNSVKEINRVRDFLSAFSADEVPDFEAIKDAEIIEPTKQEPDRPIRTLKRKVANVDVIEGVASTTLPLNIVCESPPLGEKQVNLLVNSASIQQFRQTKGEAYNQIQGISRIEIREISERLPYGLLLLENSSLEVIVIIYNQHGAIKGIISNDSEASVNWFRGKYNEYTEERDRTI